MAQLRLIVPFIGWLIGAGLVVASRVWSRRDKLIGVLLPIASRVRCRPRYESALQGPRRDERRLAGPTMDPRSRTLRRISLGDIEDAERIFELLMGNDVAPRKEFIVARPHCSTGPGMTRRRSEFVDSMEWIDFTTEHPVARPLDVRWIHGSESAKHNTDPDIQMYDYHAHTVILRQNMAINYEAPFMFLLFGNTHAVLIDTGATESAELFPLRQVVDELIERWLAENPRDGYELLVLHTHPHDDHVAGDAQLSDRPDTSVVSADLGEVSAFLGLGDDLDKVGYLDLGGRVLECLASPGHHEAAVTYYDPYTGILLTGDTVYPGRLYVQDWAAFRRTIDRLIAFAGTRPVTHVLGCHIEMTNQPGVDYPIRSTYQPDEPPLQLTVGDLLAISLAIDEIGERPGRHTFPNFVICPDED